MGQGGQGLGRKDRPLSSPIEFAIDGRIATVTLATPGKLNALSVASWDALRDAFATLSADPRPRAIVVRGTGGNFAAGADISEFETVRSNVADGTVYHERTVKGALLAISSCPIPTVALIEGACVGGGLEIACSCDLRIAAESSRFGVPINRLGFPLAHSELTALLALAGRAIALEILLEGRVFGAREAYEKGLLTHVVADDAVEAEAYATARRMAEGSPAAAAANKRWIARLTAMPEPLTEAEKRDHYGYFDTADYREGVRAFLAKTKPEFPDR
ncbi:MAG: enoyl-CoA hydratase/isomerase family protein [Burkholderiales bacterium]|nr:enoyl-CoA hydratase/isomerase family protein [Burkholderiales bacterium]